MNNNDSTIYKLAVDRRDPYASINYILSEFRKDLTNDFVAGVADDGSVPRGLISDLARKYHTTSGGVSKYLQRSGMLRINANQSLIN